MSGLGSAAGGRCQMRPPPLPVSEPHSWLWHRSLQNFSGDGKAARWHREGFLPKKWLSIEKYKQKHSGKRSGQVPWGGGLGRRDRVPARRVGQQGLPCKKTARFRAQLPQSEEVPGFLKTTLFTAYLVSLLYVLHVQNYLSVGLRP